MISDAEERGEITPGKVSHGLFLLSEVPFYIFFELGMISWGKPTIQFNSYYIFLSVIMHAECIS